MTVESLLKQITILPDGCWRWNGRQRPDQHGRVTIYVRGKHLKGHRATYLMFVGELPTGKVLDHLCCHMWCLNPSHVVPSTQQLNVLRAKRHRTHCPNGHLLISFYYRKTLLKSQPKHGQLARECRECKKAAKRRYWDRAKDSINAARRVARVAGEK